MEKLQNCVICNINKVIPTKMYCLTCLIKQLRKENQKFVRRMFIINSITTLIMMAFLINISSIRYGMTFSLSIFIFNDIFVLLRIYKYEIVLIKDEIKYNEENKNDM